MKTIERIKSLFQFRTYFPKGLMGRFMALVILPVLLSQILSGYIFYNRHWINTANQSATLFAGNVLAVIDLKDAAETPDDFAEIQKLAKRNFSMGVEFTEGGKISKQKRSNRLNQLSLKYVTRFLNQNIRRHYSLSADENTNVLEVQVQYPNGALVINSNLKSIFAKTIYIYGFWVLGSIVFFLAIAAVFVRHEVGSIKKLTDAINRAGRGEDIGEFKPSGPAQVREAGLSFVKNHNRQRRYLKSKADMLAGISHDLKTPLTRMKLEAEFFEDKNLQFAMLNDMEEMEKMIDSYLSYAKGGQREKS
ncbi:MAG: hypothetical protein LBI17_01275, partial [Rickettsiales bacterium]|nr:hypothetical protein [Rickettsiales bacterium]